MLHYTYTTMKNGVRRYYKIALDGKKTIVSKKEYVAAAAASGYGVPVPPTRKRGRDGRSASAPAKRARKECAADKREQRVHVTRSEYVRCVPKSRSRKQ